MSFKVIEWTYFATETATFKVQKNIIQNIYIQELRILCSASCQMLVNISMKFHKDILNGFQVTEQTLFCNGYTDGQTSMAKTRFIIRCRYYSVDNVMP